MKPQLTENSDSSNCQRLVDSIKENLTDFSHERKKKQMLTLAPKYWTIQKPAVFYNVSEHVVKQARKLNKEKGILALEGFFLGAISEKTVLQTNQQTNQISKHLILG